MKHKLPTTTKLGKHLPPKHSTLDANQEQTYNSPSKMYKFLMTTGKQHQEWKNENNFNPILCEQAVSSVFKSPSYDTRLYFPSLLFL